MVTMDGWMFLSSFDRLRQSLLVNYSVESLFHIGWNCFPEVHVYHRGVCFICFNGPSEKKGTFLNLSDVPATVDKRSLFLERLLTGESTHFVSRDEFARIPGNRLVYSLSQKISSLFGKRVVGNLAYSEGAMKTGDNDRFLRYWWEVDSRGIAIDGQWRLHPKGGGFQNVVRKCGICCQLVYFCALPLSARPYSPNHAAALLGLARHLLDRCDEWHGFFPYAES